MLSDSEILSELGRDVVIDPFNREQVHPNSYDVRLGEHFYVEAETANRRHADYNIYSEEDTKRTWKLEQAPLDESVGPFKGKRVLWLRPGERVLGHTVEFIGGRGRITTMIKCRSSIGRSGISVCLCAGSGDIGFINRWTLEITNHLRFNRVPLVVGERVAQMLFLRTGPCTTPYAGKYQNSGELSEIKASWRPEMMLPRLHDDAKQWVADMDFHPTVAAPLPTSASSSRGLHPLPPPGGAGWASAPMADTYSGRGVDGAAADEEGDPRVNGLRWLLQGGRPAAARTAISSSQSLHLPPGGDGQTEALLSSTPTPVNSPAAPSASAPAAGETGDPLPLSVRAAAAARAAANAQAK